MPLAHFYEDVSRTRKRERPYLGVLALPHFPSARYRKSAAMLREEATYPVQSSLTYLYRVLKCSLLLILTSPLLYGVIIHTLGLMGIEHDKVMRNTTLCNSRSSQLQVSHMEQVLHRTVISVACRLLPQGVEDIRQRYM